jgi:hypothetical protein
MILAILANGYTLTVSTLKEYLSKFKSHFKETDFINTLTRVAQSICILKWNAVLAQSQALKKLGRINSRILALHKISFHQLCIVTSISNQSDASELQFIFC